MLSIDEAIAHAREVAEIQRNNDKLNKTLGKSSPYYNTDCIKCAEEHEQLAEWLEELKMYRESSYGELYSMVYNKAIGDFMEKSEYLLCENLIYQEMEDISEQLKERK